MSEQVSSGKRGCRACGGDEFHTFKCRFNKSDVVKTLVLDSERSPERHEIGCARHGFAYRADCDACQTAEPQVSSGFNATRRRHAFQPLPIPRAMYCAVSSVQGRDGGLQTEQHCGQLRDAEVHKASMPQLPFVCSECGVQQHAEGICANCGAAPQPQPEAALCGEAHCGHNSAYFDPNGVCRCPESVCGLHPFCGHKCSTFPAPVEAPAVAETPNNIVACVSCKTGVQVTAVNAIRCVECSRAKAHRLARRIRSLFDSASNTPRGELECRVAEIILEAA